MVIVKTPAGQQVLKDRSVPLMPRQRSAFILFDGKRSLDEVLAATAASGVTRADIEHMLAIGLLARANEARPAGAPMPAVGPRADAAEPPQGSAAPARPATPQERYAAAYPVAIELTAALGLRGLRLNLAVEAATSYQQLLAVAPRIRDAVGAERYQPLQRALGEPGAA